MSGLTDLNDEWEMVNYGRRIRALVDLADDPVAVAEAINAEDDDDINALLLCAVILLADQIAAAGLCDGSER